MHNARRRCVFKSRLKVAEYFFWRGFQYCYTCNLYFARAIKPRTVID